mgnify:CR=1 FL=1
MKQNTIVFFCVGTGGHVLPVINLIDDLHQRGIEKLKIEVVTDKRGSQYFKDRDIDVHSIDIYRSRTGVVGYMLNIQKIIKKSQKRPTPKGRRRRYKEDVSVLGVRA